MNYRVLHDAEYQPLWRQNVPEVFHFTQAAPTKLTREWQELIMALNPGMDGKGFRSLLRYDKAFTNGTGFDGSPKRADFINMRDLTAKLPILDKARVCGGAVIRGTLNRMIITVEALDGRKKPPSLEWLKLHPWLYFECLTVRADGSNGRFPMNNGDPVYMPLVASGRITVKLKPIRYRMPYPCLVEV